MSINNEIKRINAAKTAIRQALSDKGLSVPPNATLDEYGTYISQLPSLKEYLEKVYPIGSIYISITASVSPASIFGGTWARIEEGRFLMAGGDTYFGGGKGGAESHKHLYRVRSNARFGAIVGDSQTGILAYDYSNSAYKAPTRINGNLSMLVNNGLGSGTTTAVVAQDYSEGSTSEESNRPPFVVVYMWQRTA